MATVLDIEKQRKAINRKAGTQRLAESERIESKLLLPYVNKKHNACIMFFER